MIFLNFVRDDEWLFPFDIRRFLFTEWLDVSRTSLSVQFNPFKVSFIKNSFAMLLLIISSSR